MTNFVFDQSEKLKNLHKDILIFLGDKNALTLPAVGSLCLSASSHSTTELQFSPYSSVDYINQLQYFSSLWEMTQIEVNRFFVKLSDTILETSQFEGKFDFPQIGSFSLQENSLSFQSAGYFEELFSKLNSTEIEIPVAIQVNQDNTSASKETEEKYVSRPLHFRKVAVVLLLFITAFVSIFIYSNFKDGISFPAHFELKDSGYESSDFNRSPVIVDVPPADIDPSDYEVIEKVIEVKPAEKEVIEESEEVNIEVDLPAENIEDENQAFQQECFYVLGSFGSQKNVDKLVLSLENIGEKAILTKVGKLNRVGVNLPCADEHRLNQLRKLSPNMWLLIQ